MARYFKPALSLTLVFFLQSAPARAQDNVQFFIPTPPQAMTQTLSTAWQLYKANDFKQALAYSESDIKLERGNPFPYYLAAVCLFKTGDTERAIKYFEIVVQYFPTTLEGRCAADLLAKVKNRVNQERKKYEWSGTGSLPKQTWIPYVKRGNSMLVDGTINGVPTKFIFDTGAEGCVFSTRKLQQLGIPLPTGKADTTSGGVGKTERIPAWTMRCTLTVGRITKRDFPVSVSDMPISEPLLGQQFFSDFLYSIDSSAQTVSFTLKDNKPAASTAAAVKTGSGMTVDSSGRYVYSVPFTRMGRNILVQAVVNDKTVPMIFDTGADISLFSAKSAAALGIQIVAHKAMKITGVSGTTMADVGRPRHIKLGAVVVENLDVSVSDQIVQDINLLGQDFMRGWHYEIDDQSKTIKFTRGDSQR